MLYIPWRLGALWAGGWKAFRFLVVIVPSFSRMLVEFCLCGWYASRSGCSSLRVLDRTAVATVIGTAAGAAVSSLATAPWLLLRCRLPFMKIPEREDSLDGEDTRTACSLTWFSSSLVACEGTSVAGPRTSTSASCTGWGLTDANRITLASPSGPQKLKDPVAIAVAEPRKSCHAFATIVNSTIPNGEERVKKVIQTLY